MHKRIGFLFFAYKREFWWFESLTLFYKLAMTVLIIFVSNGDENKVLFGMLLATTMMATLAFFQPFKHSDILSINTGGQMAVLLVLFAAMFLLINDGGGGGIAFLLVFCTLMPIAAGVSLTLRLPPEARAPDSSDALGHTLNKKVLGNGSPSLSKQFGSFKKGRQKSKAKASGDTGDFSAFGKRASVFSQAGNPLADIAAEERQNGLAGGAQNPMHAPKQQQAEGEESAGQADRQGRVSGALPTREPARESPAELPALPKGKGKLSRQLSNLGKQRSLRSVI
jgi:hypothetical protein